MKVPLGPLGGPQSPVGPMSFGMCPLRRAVKVPSSARCLMALSARRRGCSNLSIQRSWMAIAITLLVLDLHPGDRYGQVVVWVNHHSLFTQIASVDSGLLWCNLALLLAASRMSSGRCAICCCGVCRLMAQALRPDPQAPLQGRHGEVQPERPAGSRRGHLWPGT